MVNRCSVELQPGRTDLQVKVTSERRAAEDDRVSGGRDHVVDELTHTYALRRAMGRSFLGCLRWWGFSQSAAAYLWCVGA